MKTISAGHMGAYLRIHLEEQFIKGEGSNHEILQAKDYWVRWKWEIADSFFAVWLEVPLLQDVIDATDLPKTEYVY